MATRPAEVVDIHTRLLRCTLEAEHARAYWQLPSSSRNAEQRSKNAFEQSVFGSRSLARVKVLLANLRFRFDTFPDALQVLRGWQHMEPSTRALVCHWHVQLTDPMYRAFTGTFLVERHEAARPEVTRDMVTRWVGDQGPGRWTLATRTQFASQLLVTAKAAGLVLNVKDPRRLTFPRVADDALTYLLYLLRGVDFAGSLVENPYLASVGLDRRSAEDRLRSLSALHFRRQGELLDFGWVHGGIGAWAKATVAPAMAVEEAS
jgi:hypothetical protein